MSELIVVLMTSGSQEEADRIADALGVPVEGFKDMIEQMMQKYTVE